MHYGCIEKDINRSLGNVRYQDYDWGINEGTPEQVSTVSWAFCKNRKSCIFIRRSTLRLSAFTPSHDQSAVPIWWARSFSLPFGTTWKLTVDEIDYYIRTTGEDELQRTCLRGVIIERTCLMYAGFSV